jgi:outer membrane protein assembly factor BamB
VVGRTVLAVAALVVSVAACGGSDGPGDVAGPTTAAETFSAAATTTEPVSVTPAASAAEVFGCLQAEGLDLPDAGSVDAPIRFPSDVATAAWETCRDLAITALQGGSDPDATIAYLDCMAARGWIEGWTLGQSPEHHAASVECGIPGGVNTSAPPVTPATTAEPTGSPLPAAVDAVGVPVAVEADAAPAAWCAVGVPTLAAYDRVTGVPGWVRCAESADVRHDVAGVGDGAVYLTVSAGNTSRLVAVDTVDGRDRWAVRLTTGRADARPGSVVAGIDDGGRPVVASLDPASGAVRWSAPAGAGYPPFVATDDVVIVFEGPVLGGAVDPVSPPSVTAVALDRGSGVERWSAPIGVNVMVGVVGDALIASGDTFGPNGMTDQRVVVDLATGAERARWPGGHRDTGAIVGGGDGIYVVGGQDDTTRGFDLVTGEQRWERPGRLVYDDVAALGDGGIYTVEDRGAVVAYALATGATRWSLSATSDVRWPWNTGDGVVFALWTNLTVLSTDTGSVVWETTYPLDGFPRMTGVGWDEATVFVAFSCVPSGGD